MTFSAADDVGEGEDAVGHQFGVLDEVGGVADDSGNENFSGGVILDVAPDFVFMFVADVAGFEQVGLGVDPEHDIDDVAQRKVSGVRTMPAAPADVIAHALHWDALECVVQYLDAQRCVASNTPTLGCGSSMSQAPGKPGSSSCKMNPASMIARYSSRSAAAIASKNFSMVG